MSCHRSSAGPQTITPFVLDPPRPPDADPSTHHPATPPTVSQESRSPGGHPPDLSRSSSAGRSARRSLSLLPALGLARLAPDCDRDRDRIRDMRSSRSSKDPPPKPKPLLVLKLSASSFLDTIIRDDKSKDPLYILETSGENTAIHRLDYSRDQPVKAATVQWPVHPVRVKGKSGRSIQFGNGSWREAEDVLKNGPLGNTAIRKFSLPHYPNSLKWKLIPGNCFCCVTSAVKGPLAVLDAATLSAPPRLKIYDSLIDKETARSQDNYKGIPTILLDYLVTTALLLVTDVQEWLDRPREASIPGSNAHPIQRWLALIHHRPPPPEPEHPTVDLSLTVPSTPPQSASFPSPGGIWETQSGVTSLSGSNGSGSGASYCEPFTPTTPATPPTPATSVHSSMLLSRSLEDVPPVPPVPGSSPFAYTVEPSRARQRPKSNPQAYSHSPSSSSSTAQGTRPPQTLSLPAGVQGASALLSGSAPVSASVPTSPHPPASAASSSSSSSRPGRRQLPTPPVPAPPNSFAQPWLYSSSSSSSASPSTPISSPSASTLSPTTPVSAGTTNARAAARASMRGSLRTASIPPPPPPPQGSIPLPPKLAQEHQGFASRVGERPRTAPEFEDGNRRRHSAGDFGGFVSPEDEDTPASTHPYAAAAHVYTSLRGRGISERDDLSGPMRALNVSAAGPSAAPSHSHLGHVRAPSQPAPDYDAHSFVNVPPPLPPLPMPHGANGAGMRSPPGGSGRRVLTVVNGDGNAVPAEDPGRLLHADRDRRIRQQQEQEQHQRMSYAESVYEMPPPAYDAIDFSVPAVPPLPPLPPVPQQGTAHLPPIPPGSLPMSPIPLPIPSVETGWASHRES